MDTKKPTRILSRKFKRLFNEYLNCFWADIEKGGDDPDEWQEIEENLDKAQRKLFDYIAEIEQKAGV